MRSWRTPMPSMRPPLEQRTRRRLSRGASGRTLSSPESQEAVLLAVRLPVPRLSKERRQGKKDRKEKHRERECKERQSPTRVSRVSRGELWMRADQGARRPFPLRGAIGGLARRSYGEHDGRSERRGQPLGTQPLATIIRLDPVPIGEAPPAPARDPARPKVKCR